MIRLIVFFFGSIIAFIMLACWELWFHSNCCVLYYYFKNFNASAHKPTKGCAEFTSRAFEQPTVNLFTFLTSCSRNVRFFTNNQYEVIFEPNNKWYFFTYINMWKALPLISKVISYISEIYISFYHLHLTGTRYWY